MLYNGGPFPLKLPLLMGDLDPHTTSDSLGPSELTIQMASHSVQPFLHRWPQSVPILYNGTPLSPLKIALSPFNNGSLGPPEFLTQTASRSVQPFLHSSLMWQTDRQTKLLARYQWTASTYVARAMQSNESGDPELPFDAVGWAAGRASGL